MSKVFESIKRGLEEAVLKTYAYTFSFKKARTIQALYYLVKKNESMHYLKLGLLMYVADREAFTRWQETITGDRHKRLFVGPVGKNVLEILENPKESTDGVLRKINDDIVVNKNIELDQLSIREIELLEEVDNKFKACSYEELSEYCKTFKEWENPSTTILTTITDLMMFEAVFEDRSEEEKKDLMEIAAFKAGIDSINDYKELQQFITVAHD